MSNKGNTVTRTLKAANRPTQLLNPLTNGNLNVPFGYEKTPLAYKGINTILRKFDFIIMFWDIVQSIS